MRGSKPKKKRRSPGQGSIETIQSGKLRATVTVRGRTITSVPALDPANYGCRIECETECFRLLQERLDQLSDDPGLPLSTYARNWLARTRVEATTEDTVNSWIRSLERDPLGSLPVSKVTEDDLDAWKRRQRTRRITARKKLGFVHQMLGEAGNPARAVLPKKELSRKRPLSPRERETAELFDPSVDEELRLMLLLTNQAMLRRSDAAGLRHEDRDGDGIRPRYVVVHANGGPVLKPRPKSDNGIRWIPLSPALKELIGNGRTGWVLKDKKGGFIDPKRITNRVSYYLRQKGLSELPSPGPHALRRTGGMQMLEAGVDVVTAAGIMRHDPVMLLKEYTRTREDLMLDGMEKTYGKPQPKPQEDRK